MDRVIQPLCFPNSVSLGGGRNPRHLIPSLSVYESPRGVHDSLVLTLFICELILIDETFHTEKG